MMTSFGKTWANNVIHDLDFLFNPIWDQNGVVEDMMFQRNTNRSDIKYEYNLINSLVSWRHYFEPNSLRRVKWERKLFTNGGIRTTIEMRSSHFWGVTQCILVDTDNSGQSIRVICKGHSVQDRSDWLSRNVGSYQSTLRKMPEEQRSHLHCDGNTMVRHLLFRHNIWKWGNFASG